MTEAAVTPKPKLGYILLRDVRLAFPQIWEAATVGDSKEAAFSAAFLLHPTHPDLQLIRDTIELVAQNKWPKNWETMLKSIEASDKTCLHNGNRKAEYAGYENNFFVNTRSKTRPTILDANKAPLTQADGRPYGGCYCNSRIQIWATENSYGRRISAQLAGIQFLRHSDAFSGGTVAQTDDFEDVAAGDDASGLM
jgi:hypothetical protein